MFEEKIELKRKRDFSDVLNAAFAFIQQEFKPLLKTLFIYAGIPVLISAILSTLFIDDAITNMINTFSNPSAVQNNNLAVQGQSLLFNLITIIVEIFITGLTYCYIVLYAEKGANNFAPSEVWHKFTGLFASLLGFSIVNGLVLILSIIALVIPFLYVIIPISFILIIKTSENQGYSKSFERCFFLIKNHWWESFGLILIGSIITAMISLIFSIPATSYGLTKGLLQEEITLGTVPLILSSITATIGGAIVKPLSAIIIAFQYYSLVEHKDNTSLLNKINSINSDTEIKNG